MEGAAAHEAMAPLTQFDTTCRHDGLDRVGAPNGRDVEAFAAGERHSSIPVASSVVLWVLDHISKSRLYLGCAP